MESKDKFRDRGKKFRPDPDKKLMEQARECLRYYHYSYRTEQSYLSWIFRYIRFFGGKTHPRELNADSIKVISNACSYGSGIFYVCGLDNFPHVDHLSTCYRALSSVA